MKLLIWDFDGTLGYRDSVMEPGAGAWTAALLETVQREAPECPATAEELRPYIRVGLPLAHAGAGPPAPGHRRHLVGRADCRSSSALTRVWGSTTSKP